MMEESIKIEMHTIGQNQTKQPYLVIKRKMKNCKIVICANNLSPSRDYQSTIQPLKKKRTNTYETIVQK